MRLDAADRQRAGRLLGDCPTGRDRQAAIEPQRIGRVVHADVRIIRQRHRRADHMRAVVD